jgi:hypothetical protein
MLSEVIQTQKDKCFMFSVICGSYNKKIELNIAKWLLVVGEGRVLDLISAHCMCVLKYIKMNLINM